MTHTIIEDDIADSVTLECIDACTHCHHMCLQMAMNHCLEAGGKNVEPAHFRLMRDCAEICQASVSFMLSTSSFAAPICTLCAEICDACAKSCEKVGGMQGCVEACRDCARSCREMASAY